MEWQVSSTAGYADEKKIERSPVETAEWAMSSASELAERVCANIDRLCGSVTTEVQGAYIDKTTSFGGILHNLKSKAERTADDIRRANAALDRLDRTI